MSSFHLADMAIARVLAPPIRGSCPKPQNGACARHSSRLPWSASSVMVPFAFVVRPTHSPLPFPSLLSLLIFLRLRIFPLLRFHLSRVWGGRTFESPFNLLIMRQGEWPFSFLLRSSSFLLFFFPLPLSLHLSSQLERERFKFFQQPHYFGQRESSHPRSDHLELALSSFFVPYVRPVNSSLSGRARTCGSDTGTHAWRISLGRSAFTRT